MLMNTDIMIANANEVTRFFALVRNHETKGISLKLGGDDAGCVYVLVYKAPKDHPKSPRFFAINRLSRSAVVWT